MTKSVTIPRISVKVYLSLCIPHCTDTQHLQLHTHPHHCCLAALLRTVHWRRSLPRVIPCSHCGRRRRVRRPLLSLGRLIVNPTTSDFKWADRCQTLTPFIFSWMKKTIQNKKKTRVFRCVCLWINLYCLVSKLRRSSVAHIDPGGYDPESCCCSC